MISNEKLIDQIGLELFKSNKDDQANQFLTFYSKTKALKGLQIVKSLAESIRVQTETRFGINQLPEKGTEFERYMTN